MNAISIDDKTPLCVRLLTQLNAEPEPKHLQNNWHTIFSGVTNPFLRVSFKNANNGLWVCSVFRNMMCARVHMWSQNQDTQRNDLKPKRNKEHIENLRRRLLLWLLPWNKPTSAWACIVRTLCACECFVIPNTHALNTFKPTLGDLQVLIDEELACYRLHKSRTTQPNNFIQCCSNDG